MDEVQKTFREIPRRTQQQEVKMKKVLAQWDALWHSSRLYVERLKCIEILLSSLDVVTNNVSEIENKMATFTHMPSEIKPLQKVKIILLLKFNVQIVKKKVVPTLMDCFRCMKNYSSCNQRLRHNSTL